MEKACAIACGKRTLAKTANGVGRGFALVLYAIFAIMLIPVVAYFYFFAACAYILCKVDWGGIARVIWRPFAWIGNNILFVLGSVIIKCTDWCKDKR